MRLPFGKKPQPEPAADPPAPEPAADGAVPPAADGAGGEQAASGSPSASPPPSPLGPPREMPALAPVALPSGPFASPNMKVFARWTCDRVTSKNRRQRMCFLVTEDYVMAADPKSGAVHRVMALGDLHDIVVSPVLPKEKALAHVMLNSLPSLQDQSLQLYIVADPANRPTPADEHMLISAVQQARARSAEARGAPPLAVRFLEPGAEMWAYGRRYKPPGCSSPRERMLQWSQQRMRRLWQLGQQSSPAPSPRGPPNPASEAGGPWSNSAGGRWSDGAEAEGPVMGDLRRGGLREHWDEAEWRNTAPRGRGRVRPEPPELLVESPPDSPPASPCHSPAPAPPPRPPEGSAELRRLLAELLRLRAAAAAAAAEGAPRRGDPAPAAPGAEGPPAWAPPPPPPAPPPAPAAPPPVPSSCSAPAAPPGGGGRLCAEHGALRPLCAHCDAERAWRLYFGSPDRDAGAEPRGGAGPAPRPESGQRGERRADLLLHISLPSGARRGHGPRGQLHLLRTTA